MIVTLHDYNHKQLVDIAAEKDKLLKEFEEKKAGERDENCNHGAIAYANM